MANRFLPIAVGVIATWLSALVSDAVAALPCMTPLSEHRGVWAFSNGDVDVPENSCLGYGEYGYRYQCVEYARRFSAVALGYSIPKHNAIDYWTYRKVDGLQYFDNGGSEPPRVDDLIVYSTPRNNNGHIAVISDVRTTFRLEFVVTEQNWSETGFAFLDVTCDGGMCEEGRTYAKYFVAPRGSYKVKGWLRKPPASPLPSQLAFDATLTIEEIINPEYFSSQFGQSVSVGGQLVFSYTVNPTAPNTGNEIQGNYAISVATLSLNGSPIVTWNASSLSPYFNGIQISNDDCVFNICNDIYNVILQSVGNAPGAFAQMNLVGQTSVFNSTALPTTLDLTQFPFGRLFSFYHGFCDSLSPACPNTDFGRIVATVTSLRTR